MDTREQENKKYKKQKQINSKNTKNTKYQNIAKQKENNNNNKLKMSVFEGFTHPYIWLPGDMVRSNRILQDQHCKERREPALHD